MMSEPVDQLQTKLRITGLVYLCSLNTAGRKKTLPRSGAEVLNSHSSGSTCKKKLAPTIPKHGCSSKPGSKASVLNKHLRVMQNTRIALPTITARPEATDRNFISFTHTQPRQILFPSITLQFSSNRIDVLTST